MHSVNVMVTHTKRRRLRPDQVTLLIGLQREEGGVVEVKEFTLDEGVVLEIGPDA